MMMTNTSMMKKNNFKSVASDLYLGACKINDDTYNDLEDIIGRDTILNNSWETFYEPVNSRVINSSNILRLLIL